MPSLGAPAFWPAFRGGTRREAATALPCTLDMFPARQRCGKQLSLLAGRSRGL